MPRLVFALSVLGFVLAMPELVPGDALFALAAQPADVSGWDVAEAQASGRELPPLVFDDLRYAAAAWTSQDGRPLGERSVFGVNPWCEGLACADTVFARAWYRFLWRENGFDVTEPLARIEPDTTGTGTLTLALLAGTHDEPWPHQLASGFSARTGVWAARADFSMLPDDDLRVIQAFWLVASHQAVKSPDMGPYQGTAKGRFEVDFEFNNWFGDADGTDQYLSSGVYENSERGTSVPTRAAEGAPDYSCTLTRPDGQVRTAEPPECARFLAADGVWTTMLFRSTGGEARFEVRAEGPQGLLEARSDVERDAVPTQKMVTMLSQHFNGTADTPDAGRLARDHRVAFDWVYWSPEAGRSFPDVRADVAAIQSARVDGRRVDRLRTADIRLHRPYDNAPGLGAYALRPTTPVSLRIDGPDRLGTLRRGTFTSLLDDVVGTFRVEWSRRRVYADGSVGGWSGITTDASHVFRTRMPLFVACVDVRARATPMDYTVADLGDRRVVEWVPPASRAPSPLVDTHRVCKDSAPPDIR